MTREEFMEKLKKIHELYSLPQLAQRMRPEHYACVEYEKMAFEQQNEIDKLKSNWNELKKILEEQRDNPLNMEMKMFSNMVLNDMKYLETGEY